MSLLSVENIRKSYGKTPVLKDISFSLEKGEVLANYRFFRFGQNHTFKMS